MLNPNIFVLLAAARPFFGYFTFSDATPTPELEKCQKHGFQCKYSLYIYSLLFLFVKSNLLFP